jgi:ABC-type glycerol-3-phosphate transport system substrate-binding protein
VTRRKLLFLAPFVPVIVGACGLFSSDDSDTEESLGTSATATPATALTLLMPDASGSETNEMGTVLKEATFAEQYTVRPVALRPSGGQTYSEAVTQLAAAGTSPDLIWMDQFALPTLAEQGVTRALTEYTRRDIDFSTDNFWPHILSSGAYRGTLHALPLAASVCALLYNPALFFTDEYTSAGG